MRPVRRLFACFALLLAVSAAGAPRVRAATPSPETDDRFQVELEAGKLFDRFQSHEADSLGLSVSSTTVMGARWAFRVIDIPAGKLTPKPAVVLTGRIATSERTIGAQSNGGGIGRSPVLEITNGAWVRVPLDVLPGNGGVAFKLGFEGGYTLAREGGADFLTSSALAFGFERTSGAFEGSALEIATGRNEAFGSEWASGRWRGKVFLQSRIGTPRTAEPAKPAAGTAAAAEEDHRPRVFLQLDVDTDGKDGPDGIGFNVGVALDAGTTFRRALGVFGL